MGEEEEDAAGREGPLLSELHTPEIRQSFARTRQTWRRRGKWTHDVETGGRIQSTVKVTIPQCK